MSASFRRPGRLLSLAFFLIIAACLYNYFPSITDSALHFGPYSRQFKRIVVASVASDDTSWLARLLPDWRATIYVVDDPRAPLTVPKNKGHESMVYLTYIIDHYDRLPEFIIFTHGQRYQWHNDDPIYDAVPPINDLKLAYVAKVGYAPLRCMWLPGCPAELYPQSPTDKGTEERKQTERAYAAAFKELLPELPVPEAVGAPCSSQFAVTRSQILLRPRSEYVRMRKWLLETELPDVISGRIMEYTWHIAMQKPPVYCPPAGECYCVMFGHCGLNCTAAKCEKRYILPKFAQIPEGWPERGGGQDGWPVPGWNEQ